MTATGKRNGHKFKQNRTARAKNSQAAKRRPRAAPLNALRDARKQEQHGKSHQPTRNGGTDRLVGLDVLGLVNRRTNALLELPARMARCRSPFQVWGEQARFMQEGVTDYTRHMMTYTFRAFRHASSPIGRHD